MKHYALFVVPFLAFTATAGQVRVLPEIKVSNSDEPRKACSVSAVKLADHTLRNASSMGERVDTTVFEGLSADIALSWNGKGITAAILGQSRKIGGDFVLKYDGVIARLPITDGRAYIPWTRFSSAGEAPESVECLFDLEWDGLNMETLRAMPRDVRRGSIHTSMAALTAKPAFRFNPHLPRPESWGKVVFQGSQASIKQGSSQSTDNNNHR